MPPLGPIPTLCTGAASVDAPILCAGGVTASPGVGSGPVYRVDKDSDALGFVEGAVLVVNQPWPRWAALLGKCAAVVAGRGNIAGHITPLTLLDPDSPNFAPGSVRSLHDITRFCHEKSVEEMFSFGKEHHFPQRSSKQLHYKVPMQYWVINLDDGFKEEAGGKCVYMDNIASIPMLALWEGIVAVPWDGPPAMSGKGFASVIFQATANPELASPFKAPMSEGNYFMVSRNFMNLQARYGFHFSTVEALAGERDQENYLSFSFSGGATDAERKKERVRFIAEILEEYGFEVRLREDVLRSRVDSLSQAELIKRLKIVGYLLMPTRQLEMIMSEPVRVEQYRLKFSRDLKQITRPE